MFLQKIRYTSPAVWRSLLTIVFHETLWAEASLHTAGFAFFLVVLIATSPTHITTGLVHFVTLTLQICKDQLYVLLISKQHIMSINNGTVFTSNHHWNFVYLNTHNIWQYLNNTYIFEDTGVPNLAYILHVYEIEYKFIFTAGTYRRDFYFYWWVFPVLNIPQVPSPLQRMCTFSSLHCLT